MGARPLRRLLQTKLEDPMAEMLLREDLGAGAFTPSRLKNISCFLVPLDNSGFVHCRYSTMSTTSTL